MTSRLLQLLCLLGALHGSFSSSLLQYNASSGYQSIKNASQSPPAAASAAGTAASPPDSPAPSPAPDVNITEVAIDVQQAIKQPTPHLVTVKKEFEASGTTISVGESYAANTLIAQFRFAPCSGTQLHHHSNIELMQAAAGALSVGIIDPSGVLSFWNFTTGQAVVIPAGYVHYYLNRGCDRAFMIATWPAGTKTTFELLTLAAVPSSLMGSVFASGSVPAPKPNFPITQDPSCLQRCSENATPTASDGGSGR